MEQTDSWQRGWAEMMVERRGGISHIHMYEGSMDMDNCVWIDCGSRAGAVRRQYRGEKTETTVIE